MGWQPESSVFSCSPGLVGPLKQAAEELGRCCRAEGLWLETLKYIAREGRSIRERVNLTQLAEQRTELFLDWFLFSPELTDCLVAEGDQVRGNSGLLQRNCCLWLTSSLSPAGCRSFLTSPKASNLAPISALQVFLSMQKRALCCPF